MTKNDYNSNLQKSTFELFMHINYDYFIHISEKQL